MNSYNEDEDGCLEYKVVSNFNDNTIKDIIYKEYCISNICELPISERNKIINDIYNKKCSSIRQLSRVFGIGKAIVERAIKQDR